MSLILDGTNGLSDVDGSASTPAIRGTDTNTGIFFPAADTIAFAEGGTEVARFDSSGNLGIGTTSPTTKLAVAGEAKLFSLTQSTLSFGTIPSNTYAKLEYDDTNGNFNLNNPRAFPIRFLTNDTERMRIDSSGNLLVNATAQLAGEKLNVTAGGGSANGIYSYFTTTDDRANLILRHARATGGTSAPQVALLSANGSQVGTISSTGSATSYATSSDYRLKENIVPMTGALDKVSALKPVNYTWKTDGSSGQGFIAHELQAVVPDCVTGEKDAVDAEGNPVYQGIDTSFLVATLTASIQELKAIVDAQAERITALEAK